MAVKNVIGPFTGLLTELDASQIDDRQASALSNVRLDRGTIRKREGWTSKVTAGSGPILGLHNYLKNDGTVLGLAKSGSSLYRIEEDTAGSGAGPSTDLKATIIISGLSATEMADFETVNNRVYLVDGTNLKVTDGMQAFDAQIVRPLAPTAATGAAGNLVGTYDWKITFYSSTWGQESPASDPTNAVEFSSQQASITNVPSSGDSRVDKVRLYRRNRSKNETEWRFVGESLNGTGTIIDNNLDLNLDISRLAPLSFDENLPGFRYLAFQGGVLFLADGTSNRVYFTRVGEPWSVTNFLTLGSEGDGELIRGLAAFQGVLVVFKERSLWILSGTGPDTFFARKQIAGVSTRAHHSIVQVDNLLYFLGERAFYAFDGSRVTPISDGIRPDIVSRNFNRDSFVSGLHDYSTASVVWSLSSSSSSSNDLVYVYYYANSERVGVHSWSKWSMGVQSSHVLLTDPVTREPLRIIGFSDGVLGQIYGTTDNGTNIPMSWTTRKFDFGAPSRLKRWKEIAVEQVEQTSGELKVSYLNGTNTAAFLGSIPKTEPVNHFRVRERGRDLRLLFEDSDSADCEVVSFALRGEASGRSRE